MAPVAETSVRSYRTHWREGKATGQQLIIIQAMQRGIAYSRRDLARLTGLEINAVCGRVAEMLDDKIAALVPGPRQIDPVTGKRVSTVELNTGERQRNMF